MSSMDDKNLLTEMESTTHHRLKQSSSTNSDKPDSVEDETASNQVHVQALDEIVSANSFFCVAVFIGLAFSGSQDSLVHTCIPGSHVPKYILIFEVVAFGSYLFSSLTAQGLKLCLVVLNSNDKPEVFSARINPRLLRMGMLATTVGTILGTVFMTLSIVYVVEIRLGFLSCHDSDWSKWAAIPLISFVSMGLFTFVSMVLYAFAV